MWYTISQFILGIKPQYDGIMIDPCVPANWKEYTVKRKFRNGIYNIIVQNPNGKQKGISKLIVDGKEISCNIIPNLEGKHEVIAIM